jgi:hypothetical protein
LAVFGSGANECKGSALPKFIGRKHPWNNFPFLIPSFSARPIWSPPAPAAPFILFAWNGSAPAFASANPAGPGLAYWMRGPGNSPLFPKRAGFSSGRFGRRRIQDVDRLGNIELCGSKADFCSVFFRYIFSFSMRYEYRFNAGFFQLPANSMALFSAVLSLLPPLDRNATASPFCDGSRRIVLDRKAPLVRLNSNASIDWFSAPDQLRCGCRHSPRSNTPKPQSRPRNSLISKKKK